MPQLFIAHVLQINALLFVLYDDSVIHYPLKNVNAIACCHYIVLLFFSLNYVSLQSVLFSGH